MGIHIILKLLFFFSDIETRGAMEICFAHMKFYNNCFCPSTPWPSLVSSYPVVAPHILNNNRLLIASEFLSKSSSTRPPRRGLAAFVKASISNPKATGEGFDNSDCASKNNNGGILNSTTAQGSGTTARGRRLLRVREEKRKREYDRIHNYPAWAKLFSSCLVLILLITGSINKYNLYVCQFTCSESWKILAKTMMSFELFLEIA